MSQQWKVLMAFTGIFVAGAVAGGIVALRVGADRVAEPIQSTASAPQPSKTTVVSPENFSLVQMRQFIAQLGLSSAQSSKIQPIVNSTGERLKKLSQESAAATKTELEDMDKQVDALLDPDQRKKLADNEKRWQDRMRKGPPVFPGARGRGNLGGPGSNTGSFSAAGREPMGRRDGPQPLQTQPSPMPAGPDVDVQP